MEPQIAFDTHAFVKRLTGAGMPETQAEIIAWGKPAVMNTSHPARP